MIAGTEDKTFIFAIRLQLSLMPSGGLKSYLIEATNVLTALDIFKLEFPIKKAEDVISFSIEKVSGELIKREDISDLYKDGSINKVTGKQSNDNE